MLDIGLIIWTAYRPAQLDLLLSSIDRFAPEQFDIMVLYKGDDEYSDGYTRCRELHPNVCFVKEYNFRDQTIAIVNSRKYIGVSTDDTVLYRPFKFTEELMRNVDVFSARLGFNTTVQDPFSHTMQPALTKYVDEGDTVCWNASDYHPLTNYGFLIGHDFCIYGERYQEWIKKAPFNRTNELESWMFYHARANFSPYIRAFKHSIAVNIPMNNISTVTETDNSSPLEQINSEFIQGKRFNLDDILKEKIVGCHQQIKVGMYDVL